MILEPPGYLFYAANKPAVTSLSAKLGLQPQVNEKLLEIWKNFDVKSIS